MAALINGIWGGYLNIDFETYMNPYIKKAVLVTTFICLIIISGCKFPLEESYETDESIKNDDNRTAGIYSPPYP